MDGLMEWDGLDGMDGYDGVYGKQKGPLGLYAQASSTTSAPTPVP